MNASFSIPMFLCLGCRNVYECVCVCVCRFVCGCVRGSVGWRGGGLGERGMCVSVSIYL